MSSTAELKKIKLNVTNIKSVLLDGKKAVDEKKKDREDFLDKLAEEKKQKQEEKGLEKPITPTQKKPDLKSPVKSSMGLMDRIFNFVGAIVGGIVVKALPDIIDAVKKVIEYVKPIFEKIVEGLQPVFKFIGDIFKDKGSYDSEKEKVDGNIEEANLMGKDIDGQAGELDKSSEDLANENKGLAANSDALSSEEKDLQKDPEQRKDDKEEVTEENTEEDKEEKSEEITSNEGATDAGLTPTTTIDGGEESTSDSTTVTLESSDKTDTSGDENFLDKVSKSEFTGVKILTAPVRPVREDFPRTRAGMKAYVTAVKNYNVQYKEFRKSQKDLIKPTEKNKNGLTALNSTDGLTSMNGSGSTTIVYQRQVVQVPVATPIKV